MWVETRRRLWGLVRWRWSPGLLIQRDPQQIARELVGRPAESLIAAIREVDDGDVLTAIAVAEARTRKRKSVLAACYEQTRAIGGAA